MLDSLDSGIFISKEVVNLLIASRLSVSIRELCEGLVNCCVLPSNGKEVSLDDYVKQLFSSGVLVYNGLTKMYDVRVCGNDGNYLGLVEDVLQYLLGMVLSPSVSADMIIKIIMGMTPEFSSILRERIRVRLRSLEFKNRVNE